MLKINDLSARVAGYEAKLNKAFSDVIDSGWFILGPKVAEFEIAFANYIGGSYCVSVANGTDAIEIALRALGVTVGDAVATVANAGMYTTTAVLAIGAQPVYMDVDLHTKNVTMHEVERVVSSGVKAVVVTHLYGLAVSELEQISSFCASKGVLLLEDCAQAHGARLNGKTVGVFGDAASFSFYPTKNLGALGDGGAIITSNRIVAEKAMGLRQYGWKSKYQVEIGGARNSRLDELQASILSIFLPDLDESNAARRRIACRYSEGIKNPLVVHPFMGCGADYVAHLYVVRSKLRDLLKLHLSNHGIASDVHYPVPDYSQPVFGGQFKSISLKNSEVLSEEVLTLPCYPEMTENQINEVIVAVNSWNP